MNAAVIGLGVGEQHLLYLTKDKSIQNIKIFDKNLKKLSSIAKKYKKVTICKNINDIINDKSISLVCIATYDETHFSLIKRCLNKNKNIFVEKPAVTNEKHAAIIFKMLKLKKNYFSTNYILRKSNRFKKIDELLKKNSFGKIYSIEGEYNYGRLYKITKGWRSKEKNYSVTLGGGIHIIDSIIYLLKKLPIKVYSEANNIITKNSKFKGMDYVTSILKFKDQTIAKISSNFGCVYPHFHKINIYGSKKTFENFYEYGKIYSKRDSVAYKKIINKYKSYKKSDVFKEFINDIKNKKNRMAHINQTFQALSICFAIEKSVIKNNPIKIKYFK